MGMVCQCGPPEKRVLEGFSPDGGAIQLLLGDTYLAGEKAGILIRCGAIYDSRFIRMIGRIPDH